MLLPLAFPTETGCPGYVPGFGNQLADGAKEITVSNRTPTLRRHFRIENCSAARQNLVYTARQIFSNETGGCHAAFWY